MTIDSPGQIDWTKIKIDEHPYWAPTTAYSADACMKRYALGKILRVDYEVPVEIAKGDLLHQFLEKKRFWKSRGGVFVPYYRSAESFANSIGGDWKLIRSDSRITRSRKPIERRKAKNIRWKNEGERWSPKTLDDLIHMGRMAYRTEIERGPPISTEVDFKVQLTHPSLPDCLRGLKLKGQIDYIRDPLILGDHKTGYDTINGNFLRENFQLIHYALSTWQALQDPETIVFQRDLSDYAGISLTDFLDSVRLEINHIPSTIWKKPEDRPSQSQIYSTSLSLDNLIELGEILRKLEEEIARRRFLPCADKKFCNYCFYEENCEKFNLREIFSDEYKKRSPLFAFAGINPNVFGKPAKPSPSGFKQTTMRLFKATNELRI
jgi:hypothetical protein